MTDTSLVNIEDVGELNLYQLKRFWHTIQENKQSIAHQDYHVNRLLLSALGIGLHQGLFYLYTERPTFQQFESWIKHNAVLLSDEVVQRFNHAIVHAPLSKITAEKFKFIDEHPDVLDRADLKHWQEFGYVIVKNAVSIEDSRAAEQAIWQHIQAIPDEPSTWYGKNDSQIMVELIQHSALQHNRNNIKIHKAFSQLWGTTDLWCSADRCSFHPPLKTGYDFPGPDLHWDMDLNKPDSFCTQGILYLTDTSAEQGALTLVPSFQHKLQEWLTNLDKNQDPQQQDLHSLGSKAIAAQAGDLIIWHHALPHGSRPNVTQQPRIAQYINFYPFDLKN
ncbi:phytanoyl-CoA dioxygenase family protein [Shewanella sp. 10N.286.45.A1]|uniref:phytanoyl-CoA dioxygenase family protein n=1 Tax=Shewanella sp. 10N.286.45.A1 TaxID=3229694 RepID=UPI00354B6E5A